MNPSGLAKYVVIKDSHGTETVYIFDGRHPHKWFSEKIGGTVVSAGFVAIRGSHVMCTGESMTLGIGVRKDDEVMVRKLLGYK